LKRDAELFELFSLLIVLIQQFLKRSRFRCFLDQFGEFGALTLNPGLEGLRLFLSRISRQQTPNT
jgi:hypothetical protein